MSTLISNQLVIKSYDMLISNSRIGKIVGFPPSELMKPIQHLLNVMLNKLGTACLPHYVIGLGDITEKKTSPIFYLDIRFTI